MDIDNAKNEGIWNNDWDLSLEFIKRFKKNKKFRKRSTLYEIFN